MHEVEEFCLPAMMVDSRLRRQHARWLLKQETFRRSFANRCRPIRRSYRRFWIFVWDRLLTLFLPRLQRIWHSRWGSIGFWSIVGTIMILGTVILADASKSANKASVTPTQIKVATSYWSIALSAALVVYVAIVTRWVNPILGREAKRSSQGPPLPVILGWCVFCVTSALVCFAASSSGSFGWIPAMVIVAMLCTVVFRFLSLLGYWFLHNAPPLRHHAGRAFLDRQAIIRGGILVLGSLLTVSMFSVDLSPYLTRPEFIFPIGTLLGTCVEVAKGNWLMMAAPIAVCLFFYSWASPWIKNKLEPFSIRRKIVANYQSVPCYGPELIAEPTDESEAENLTAIEVKFQSQLSAHRNPFQRFWNVLKKEVTIEYGWHLLPLVFFAACFPMMGVLHWTQSQNLELGHQLDHPSMRFVANAIQGVLVFAIGVLLISYELRYFRRRFGYEKEPVVARPRSIWRHWASVQYEGLATTILVLLLIGTFFATFPFTFRYKAIVVIVTVQWSLRTIASLVPFVRASGELRSRLVAELQRAGLGFASLLVVSVGLYSLSPELVAGERALVAIFLMGVFLLFSSLTLIESSKCRVAT